MRGQRGKAAIGFFKESFTKGGMIMISTRTKQLAAALLAGTFIIALYVGTSPQYGTRPTEGRVLSDREMSSTFGDADPTPNMLCKKAGSCQDTRLGQIVVNNNPVTACIKCDQTVTWRICCAASTQTDYCNVDSGNYPCRSAPLLYAIVYEQTQGDCRNKCGAGTFTPYEDGSICNSRQDATGSGCNPP